jgi:hypothetical protein
VIYRSTLLPILLTVVLGTAVLAALGRLPGDVCLAATGVTLGSLLATRVRHRRRVARLRSRAGIAPPVPRRQRRAAHRRTARRMWKAVGQQRERGNGAV